MWAGWLIGAFRGEPSLLQWLLSVNKFYFKLSRSSWSGVVRKRIIPDTGVRGMFQHRSTLTDLEKGGWCFLLCLDCRVEGDLFHAVDLISTSSISHLLSPPSPELCPSDLPSPLHFRLICVWKLAGGTALNWAGRLEAAASFPHPCGFTAHGIILM